MKKVLFLFGRLRDQDIDWLASAGARRAVPRGEVVIREGTPADAMYIVVEGEFSITKQALAGREVNRLGVGEVIGEMSLVDAAPPAATVTAGTDSVVLAVPRDVLLQRLRRDEGFASRFYHSIATFLSDRLRTVEARYEAGAGPLRRNELDPSVLDTIAIAGERFDRLVRQLRG